MVVSVRDVAAGCQDDLRWCEATVPIEVRSCEREPVVIERVEISFPAGGVMVLQLTEPRLAYGEVRRQTVNLSRQGDYEVSVAYRWEKESTLHSASGHFRVTNPTRDAALAACEACQGQWGGWGMSGREGCNCRTKDGGKLCHDGDECEGACLFERFEVIRKPSGPVCGPNGCQVTLGLGVPVGRCSDRQMSFGCRAIIAHGASKEPPRTLPAHAPSTCVD